MEWFCPVSFDEADTREDRVKEFKSTISSLSESYYSRRGKDHAHDRDDEAKPANDIFYR